MKLTVMATDDTPQKRQVGLDAPASDSGALFLWHMVNLKTGKVQTREKFRHAQTSQRIMQQVKKHARKLCHDNWFLLCESFEEHTLLSKPWSIFNAMFGRTHTKQTIQSLALGCHLTMEILEETGLIFFPPQPATIPDHQIY